MDLLSNDDDGGGFFSTSSETLNEENPRPRLNTNSNSRNRHRFSTAYLRELSPTRRDFEKFDVQDSIIVSSVEKAMKNYADGVLRILDGTSSRLLQVERAANNLRQSVSSLKDSVDDYYDQTNKNYGKLNEHVMEVQRSIQILRDKQDAVEVHAQLAKLQASKSLSEKESSGYSTQIVKKHQEQEIAPSQVHQSLQPSTVPQPQGILVKHTRQQEPMQYVQHGQTLQIIQQVPNLQSSDQVQYQVIPQNAQNQPLEVTTQQNVLGQQSVEQMHFIAMPQKMHIQQQQSQPQAVLQQTLSMHQQQVQGPQVQHQMQQQIQVPQVVQLQQQGQQQLQQKIRQVQQQQIQKPPPGLLDQGRFQPTIQQMQNQLQIPHQPSSQQMLQQTTVMQPPPYPQPNDSQTYTSGMHSVGDYQYATSETSYAYNANQHPFPVTNQSPTSYDYQQQSNQPSPQVLSNINSGPIVWHGQPRLQMAQPIHNELRSSSEINGIIEKISAMGFSRDQVQSMIRRRLEQGLSVDMNVILDILMNGA